MICAICQNNAAILDPYWGYLPCLDCKEKQSKQPKPKLPAEMATQELKDSRKEHNKEILQPFREGTLSKEYIDEYGADGLDVTPEEVRTAKNVWSDIKYYD